MRWIVSVSKATTQETRATPNGQATNFKNNTDQPIRVFINIAPSGFEHFFAEAAEDWAKPERDMSRITTIAEKYGHHSVDQ
jgi:hypothetical protein